MVRLCREDARIMGSDSQHSGQQNAQYCSNSVHFAGLSVANWLSTMHGMNGIKFIMVSILASASTCNS